VEEALQIGMVLKVAKKGGGLALEAYRRAGRYVGIGSRT